NFNNPGISKKLLTYRYNTLDYARKRAIEVGFQRGALFPWRTIGGEECSTFFPAGTAQYHINADIVYAIKKYIEVTEDQEFLIEGGSEILFETARLWMELGAFIARKDNRFCINVVTGPDEYTALVDNNFYTNMMARENLYFAYQTAVWMKENSPESFKQLSKKIGLEDEELALWEKAANHMYIPYDRQLGIFPQDDTFLDKPIWDLEKTPADKFPLLLH
ncbi:MAG TPA: family 65 glycosyl hydrolase, partial [Firmicutes bacterium]|nr:family 65 glycosyl hydrolase [Bacillota bacterium]